MTIHLHRDFKKRFQTLKSGEQRAFQDRRDLFMSDQFHHLLNNHALKGRWNGWRSINIAGDLRVIFKEIDPAMYLFFQIGTHHELYG